MIYIVAPERGSWFLVKADNIGVLEEVSEKYRWIEEHGIPAIVWPVPNTGDGFEYPMFILQEAGEDAQKRFAEMLENGDFNDKTIIGEEAGLLFEYFDPSENAPTEEE